jgi:hypothetical protein
MASWEQTIDNAFGCCEASYNLSFVAAPRIRRNLLAEIWVGKGDAMHS